MKNKKMDFLICLIVILTVHDIENISVKFWSRPTGNLIFRFISALYDSKIFRSFIGVHDTQNDQLELTVSMQIGFRRY